ncbi:MAG: hypothetical protein K8S54_16020 [Spirochaetia bacterium]|nr:hypothetical protein [Spirochaetia bacterium]
MKMKFALILFLTIIMAGCQFKVGSFKRMDKEAPPGLTELGGTVFGENCVYGFPLTGDPNLQAATNEAILRGPEGTTGLKDAVVETRYILFINGLCYKVTGIPVKEK